MTSRHTEAEDLAAVDAQRAADPIVDRVAARYQPRRSKRPPRAVGARPVPQSGIPATRGKPGRTLVNERRLCTVTGCDEFANRAGVCRHHYGKILAVGTGEPAEQLTADQEAEVADRWRSFQSERQIARAMGVRQRLVHAIIARPR